MIYCILYCMGERRRPTPYILKDQELHDRGISVVIRDSLSALMVS